MGYAKATMYKFLGEELSDMERDIKERALTRTFATPQGSQYNSTNSLFWGPFKNNSIISNKHDHCHGHGVNSGSFIERSRNSLTKLISRSKTQTHSTSLQVPNMIPRSQSLHTLEDSRHDIRNCMREHNIERL